jgi:hypothetical protein
MDQPPLTGTIPDSPAASHALSFLPAETAGRRDGGPFVAVARDLANFTRRLLDAPPELQWIQVDNLLGEPDAWTTAARAPGDVSLDVVMTDPGAEFPWLYRLVDVAKVRDLRVTIPVRGGFLKALRLAAAIRLPVRLLPTQPDPEELDELAAAADFYLHDPMVETPVEFFHSVLGWCSGAATADLWIASERDPAVFQHFGPDGALLLPAGRPGVTAAGFVDDHLDRLDSDGAPCAACRWRGFCRGFFKLPDPAYSCAGIVGILDRLEQAARQMGAGLAEHEPRQGTAPDQAGKE